MKLSYNIKSRIKISKILTLDCVSESLKSSCDHDQCQQLHSQLSWCEMMVRSCAGYFVAVTMTCTVLSVAMLEQYKYDNRILIKSDINTHMHKKQGGSIRKSHDGLLFSIFFVFHSFLRLCRKNKPKNF